MVDQLGRSRYEPVRAGLRTWLSALARNKSTDVIRQRTRHASRNLNEVGVFEIPCREADRLLGLPSSRRNRPLVHSASLAVLCRRWYPIAATRCSTSARSARAECIGGRSLTLGLSLEEVRYRHFRTPKQELRRLVEISEW